MNDFIDLIYAAVEDTSKWNIFLDKFRVAMRATMATLFITTFDAPAATFSIQRGIPDEVLAIMKRPDFRDPWLSRIDMSTAVPGRIVRSNEICPDEILEQDPWYQLACFPFDLHYGGGVLLENSTTRLTGMSCNRPRRIGPLSDREVAFWQELAPHAARAVRLTGIQTNLSRERDALMRYFEDFSQGMILTTPEGLVLAANVTAKSILQDGRALRICGESIAIADEESGDALREALARTGSTSAPDPLQILIRNHGKIALIATVVPLQKAGDRQVSPKSPTAAVYLLDPGASITLDPAPLRLLFKFTKAESRLACLLASGLSLSEAAEGLGVSLNTVRTHLQRALAKAGVKRQAELVAVVLKTSRSLRS